MAKTWVVIVLVAIALVVLLLLTSMVSSKKRNHWANNLEIEHLKSLNLKTTEPKVVIITLEDRPLTELLDIHNRSVQQYADYHGYKYRFLSKFDSPLPVYWKKLHWMQQVMEENECDFVLWLDSDTMIPNPRVPLSTIVNHEPSASIYIAKDYPYLSISAFCAGIFLVRNNSIGREFVADCLESSVNNPKCLVDDKPALNGLWAGECYEQGVMNRLAKGQYQQHLCSVPQNLITNAPPQFTNFNAVIVHCPGNKDACANRFKTFLAQDQSLPVVKNPQPLRVCLLLTVHCLPNAIAQYSRALQRWSNDTQLPLYIVDSAGENLLQSNQAKTHYYCFKQEKSGISERESIIRAAEHFSTEFSQYDLVCKVDGKYFLSQLESTLNYIPAGTDVVLQFNRSSQKQNCELFAIKPSMLIPLALQVSSHQSLEQALANMTSQHSIRRFPPFDTQGGSRDAINYL